MAQVSYSPVPTVEPQVGLPNDYQNIQARPDSFGATIAQGVQQAGAGALKANQFYGEVAADDATNQYMEGARKILKGDPNDIWKDENGQPILDEKGQSQPDRGFFGLQGDAAMRAQPGIEAKLEKLRQSLHANMGTPAQQLMFDQNTRRMQYYQSLQIGSHADSQANVWATKVEASSGANAKQAIADAMLNGDMAEADRHANDLVGINIRAATRLGARPGDEVFEAAKLHGKMEAVETKIMAVLPTNPALASQILETPENRAALAAAGRYDAIAQAVKTHNNKAEVGRLVEGAIGGAPGMGDGAFRASPGAPIAGAAPDEQVMLNEIRHRESSGNYANIGPVIKEGPHAGETAKGGFQFIDSTWREATQGSGQGAQYATADKAPPAIQDANALWTLRNRGTQPWSSSGPYPNAEAYRQGVAQGNQQRQAARGAGQPLPPTMAANVRADYATALARIESSPADPEVKAAAISQLHARFSFEQSLAEKEERDADKNRIDDQRAVWSRTMAGIERGQPPSHEQLATLLESRQIDQSQYASVEAKLSGRGERDDPATYATLNRRSRAGEDVTQDVYDAIQNDRLRPQSADTILNLGEARRAQRENQTERAAFATLRTISGMDAQEHPMVNLTGEAAAAQVQLWTQAQQEWNQRVHANNEKPMDVLQDMIPRYEHPPTSIHALPQPRMGAIAKPEDVTPILTKTQAAFDGGQLTRDQYYSDVALIKRYEDMLNAQQKRQEAARAAAAKNAGRARGRSSDLAPAEMQ